MDSEDASLFAKIQHDLGRLLYHSVDPHGDDKIILRADWLSKAISFVLEDDETNRCHGFLVHRRLRSIWEDYPNEVHGLFLGLMQQNDLCYPVEGAEASLVAQLVAGERPEFEFAELGPGEQELTQVCEIIDRETNKPKQADGLFYRLIVRLHRHSLGREDFTKSRQWQTGLVLTDHYGSCRALLEYIDHDVRVTVRGIVPAYFLHQLTQVVKDIVDEFWPGLLGRIMVPCRISCKKGQPGRGRFELQQLLATAREGIDKVYCQVPGCRSWQPLDELLANAPTSRSDTSVHDKLDRILDDTTEIKADVAAQKNELDALFADLYDRLDDDGRRGPRLFSVSFVDPGFLDRPKWITATARVTLWCEHSRLPVFYLEERQWEPGAPGVYNLELPRAWLESAAPFARIVGRALGLSVRIASAGLATGNNLGVHATESLAKLFEHTNTWLKAAGDGPGDPRNDLIQRAEGPDLRVLHRFLGERDPSFGGLERVRDAQYNRYIWVHHQFRNIYAPRLRGLDDSEEPNA